MPMTVEKTLEDLKKLFNRVDEVYFSKTAINDPESIGKCLALPVGNDGVTLDLGAADITKYKLTTGDTWTAIADAGDADISFQVPSIDDEIASLFQNKKTSTKKSVSITVGDTTKTYKGHGYNIAPKKVVGGLVLRSQDESTIIILPNVEIYANGVLDDTSKPMYFNLSVTPENNSEGVAIYYMFEDTTATVEA